MFIVPNLQAELDQTKQKDRVLRHLEYMKHVLQRSAAVVVVVVVDVVAADAVVAASVGSKVPDPVQNTTWYS